MVINCKNCSGQLSYRIKENDLICSHCLSTFKVDEIDCSNFTCNDYTCESCGAGIVYTNDEIKINKCPYCGSKSFKKIPLNTEYDYKGIVPFKIDKNDLIKLIHKILEKENSNEEFLKEVENATFRQVYLPYSYQDQFFNDLAFSSENEYENRPMKYESTFSNNFFTWAFQEIAPYDEHDIKPFNPIYLENSVAYVITQQFENNFFKSRKPDYFLVPVWVVEINHKNQKYILVVNGTSGELAGEFLKDYTLPSGSNYNRKKPSCGIILILLILVLSIFLTAFQYLLDNMEFLIENISKLPVPTSFKLLFMIVPIILFIIVIAFIKWRIKSSPRKKKKIFSKREKINTRTKI